MEGSIDKHSEAFVSGDRGNGMQGLNKFKLPFFQISLHVN